MSLLAVAGVVRAQEEEILDALDEPAGAGRARREALVSAGSLSGYAWTELAVDTTLENGREVAAAWMSYFHLRASVEHGQHLRAVASARLRAWTLVERNESGAPFVLANGEGWRAGYEVAPGDAFVELAPWSGLRLTVGLQTFHWGQNDLSPADTVNPRDLRWGLPVDLAELKLPVPAVALALDRGQLHVDVVALPFYSPTRAWLTGYDFALLSPGGGQLPVDARGFLTDALSDGLQQGAVAGFGPEGSLASASLALRIAGRLAGVDLAAGWMFGWDPVPAVHFEHELGQLLVEAATPSPRLVTINALLAKLRPRVAAGEVLFTSEHDRQHRAFAEAGAALGDFVLKLDAGLSVDQTFYVTGGPEPIAPVRHPLLALALGADWRYRDRLLLSLEWIAGHLFGPVGDQRLFLFSRDTHELLAAVRAQLVPGRLELGGLALIGVTQGDWVVQSSVTWRASTGLSLAAGLTLWQGSPRGLGGFFDHTDALFARARIAF